MKETKPITLIFWATAEIALPSFLTLLNDTRFAVLGLVTGPDKKQGRGQRLLPSSLKVAAQSTKLKIWQPTNLKTATSLYEELKSLAPKVMVLFAYGKIIPQKFLDLAPSGMLNVHPSLLPKYRGASPLIAAILAGEKETGVTFILLDEQIDHGPIIYQKKLPIAEEDTQEALSQKMAKVAAELLPTVLTNFLADKIKPWLQNDKEATYCRLIKKEDGKIDWFLSAQKIRNQVYAFHPWPGTFTFWPRENKEIKILPPVKIIANNQNLSAGTVFLTTNKELAIASGQGAIIIKNLQLASKKPMTAAEFLRGYNRLVGQNLISH